MGIVAKRTVAGPADRACAARAHAVAARARAEGDSERGFADHAVMHAQEAEWHDRDAVQKRATGRHREPAARLG